MMDINMLLGMGSVPVVIGLVEVIKPFLGDDDKARRWYPIAAMLFGVSTQLLVGWVLNSGVSPTNAASNTIIGIIIGLSASGLYSASKQLWPGGSVAGGPKKPDGSVIVNTTKARTRKPKEPA